MKSQTKISKMIDPLDSLRAKEFRKPKYEYLTRVGVQHKVLLRNVWLGRHSKRHTNDKGTIGKKICTRDCLHSSAPRGPKGHRPGPLGHRPGMVTNSQFCACTCAHLSDLNSWLVGARCGTALSRIRDPGLDPLKGALGSWIH